MKTNENDLEINRFISPNVYSFLKLIVNSTINSQWRSKTFFLSYYCHYYRPITVLIMMFALFTNNRIRVIEPRPFKKTVLKKIKYITVTTFKTYTSKNTFSWPLLF